MRIKSEQWLERTSERAVAQAVAIFEVDHVERTNERAYTWLHGQSAVASKVLTRKDEILRAKASRVFSRPEEDDSKVDSGPGFAGRNPQDTGCLSRFKTLRTCMRRIFSASNCLKTVEALI